MTENNGYKTYAGKIFAHHNFNAECVPADSGVMNHVFLSNDYVVRMPKDGTFCNFPGEKWATERAREQGVPAPKVIAVDMSKSLVPVQYMIVERLPGQRVKDSTPEMCRELGELLARIHNIKTVGYGKVDENGVGPKSDWKAHIDVKRSLLPGLARIDPSLAKRAESVYDDLEKYPQPPCLVHGDYGLHNMVFADGKLTGVFDFTGRSDSSYLDIGDLLRHAPRVITHIEEGYGSSFDYHLALLYSASNAAIKLPFMIKTIPTVASKMQRGLEETLVKLGK